MCPRMLLQQPMTPSISWQVIDQWYRARRPKLLLGYAFKQWYPLIALRNRPWAPERHILEITSDLSISQMSTDHSNPKLQSFKRQKRSDNPPVCDRQRGAHEIHCKRRCKLLTSTKKKKDKMHQITDIISTIVVIDWGMRGGGGNWRTHVRVVWVYHRVRVKPSAFGGGSYLPRLPYGSSFWHHWRPTLRCFCPASVDQLKKRLDVRVLWYIWCSCLIYDSTHYHGNILRRCNANAHMAHTFW